MLAVTAPPEKNKTPLFTSANSVSETTRPALSWNWKAGPELEKVFEIMVLVIVIWENPLELAMAGPVELGLIVNTFFFCFFFVCFFFFSCFFFFEKKGKRGRGSGSGWKPELDLHPRTEEFSTWTLPLEDKVKQVVEVDSGVWIMEVLVSSTIPWLEEKRDEVNSKLSSFALEMVLSDVEAWIQKASEEQFVKSVLWDWRIIVVLFGLEKSKSKKKPIETNQSLISSQNKGNSPEGGVKNWRRVHHTIANLNLTLTRWRAKSSLVVGKLWFGGKRRSFKRETSTRKEKRKETSQSVTCRDPWPEAEKRKPEAILFWEKVHSEISKNPWNNSKSKRESPVKRRMGV